MTIHYPRLIGMLIDLEMSWWGQTLGGVIVLGEQTKAALGSILARHVRHPNRSEMRRDPRWAEAVVENGLKLGAMRQSAARRASRRALTSDQS